MIKLLSLKLGLFWIFLLVAILVSHSHAADQSRFPEDIQRIKDRGKILIAAYSGEIPPFLYIKPDGGLAGIDYEMAQDIAGILGVDIQFIRESETFDALPEMIEQRRADIIISNFSRTIKRALTVNFTEPYIQLKKVLFINRMMTINLVDSNGDYHQLNRPSVLIGANEGGIYSELAREMFPNATIRLYKDHHIGTADMLAGKIHGYLCDQPCANSYSHPQEWDQIKPPDDWGIKIRTIILSESLDPIVMAVNYKDVGLYAWLRVFLEERKNDGTLARTAKKYRLD